MLMALSSEPAECGLEALPGTVTKPGGPLFRGTNKWEHNIDNGYSNVLYDEADTFGLGKYRVYYSAGDEQFKGSIPGESSGTATLYATSDDGLIFDKPALNLVKYDNSTENNILFDGTTALAIFDDSFHDKNKSRRFKVWGNLPGLVPADGSDVGQGLPPAGKPAQLGGSAVSSNGLNFTDYRRLQNTTLNRDTLRFDAEASMFFDTRTDRYVGTMRAFRPCAMCGACPIWWQPHGGCQTHVSPTCTAAECNQTVRAIGASISSSADFQTTTWGPNVEIQRNDEPTHQLYSQITFPFYNIYLGVVMVFKAIDPPNVYGKGKVHCELSWSPDPFSKKFQRLRPGTDFIPLGDIATRDFDSHICFASAFPVKLHNETRVYYFGGGTPFCIPTHLFKESQLIFFTNADGPHYSPSTGPLHRNSSFGVTFMRPDGFVALRAVGKAGGRASYAPAMTMPLKVEGEKLIVTADTDVIPAGAVELHAHTPDGTRVECGVVKGENVTNKVLGCDLSRFRAMNVTIEIGLSGAASLYTLGFQ